MLSVLAHNLTSSLTRATSALYCYEWFITFDQEVNHVWTRKWSLSTWIFAVNRYATLFDTLLQVFPSPSRAVRSANSSLPFNDPRVSYISKL